MKVVASLNVLRCMFVKTVTRAGFASHAIRGSPMANRAVCIGGPIDGHITDIAWPPMDYTLQSLVTPDNSNVLHFYVFKGLTITAAIHTVFAHYTTKGKKANAKNS